MLEKLIEKLNTSPQSPPDEYDTPFGRKKVAVAALLVEASQIDRHNDPAERAAVARVLRDKCHFSSTETDRLVSLAEEALAAALDDWVFTKAVKDSFTPEAQREIIGMLWEVVYTGGKLDRFENSLVLRIAAELGVSAEEAEASRLAALSRLGMDSAR